MARDWSFAKSPFWLFSHLFVAAAVALFVTAGLWQLSRHNERAAANDVIESRSETTPVDVDTITDSAPAAVDYMAITATGSYVADDVVRVANRSQGGVAGTWLVSVFETVEGNRLLINRGFVPSNQTPELASAPTGVVTIDGWARQSATKGFLGATDTGDGQLVPRLNIDDIETRLNGPVADIWLQLSPSQDGTVGSFPDPVPLPPVDGGPHFSYMVQWFIFATLVVAFYTAILRRRSSSISEEIEETATSAGGPTSATESSDIDQSIDDSGDFLIGQP